MGRFERALDDCLERLMGEEAGLEDCLQGYPEFADELRPLLKAASQVKRGAEAQPSPEFRRRGRAQLMTHMRAHPRRSVTYRTRGLAPAYRLAIGLTTLVLAVFVTGTAFAQSAMPGDLLYGWKLASESAWRAVSPDPVATDLALAGRRTQELLAVSGPDRGIALQGYQQVLNRLVSQTDPVGQQRIFPILTVQRERLAQSGILVPDLDKYLSSHSVPTPLPQPSNLTPSPQPSIPTSALPNLTSTPALPLELPTLDLPSILATPTP